MGMKYLPGSLPQGKERLILDLTTTGAGSESAQFGVDADDLIISLFVESITGTLDITVETIGLDNQTATVATFPQVSAPTANLILRKTSGILDKVRITATYSGICDFEVRVRGIGVGDISSGDVDFDPLLVTNPSIQNITLVTAGVEQAVTLPAGTKRFRFQATNKATLQYAYTPLATELMTVFPVNTEEEDDINQDAVLTLYIRSNQNATPIQVIAWT